MLKIRRVMIIVLIIVAGVSFVMQKDDMTVRALTAENVTIIEAS